MFRYILYKGSCGHDIGLAQQEYRANIGPEHKLYGLRKCYLLPTGSEEREVFGLGGIPVAVLPSCKDMKTIAL